MKRQLFFIAALFIAAFSRAQVYDTVNVSVPGTLLGSLHKDAKSITHLTLSGKIDSLDFITMRDSMKALSVLDLQNTTIDGNKFPYGAFRYGYYNGIPNYSLKSVILPNSINELGDYSFYLCKALERVYAQSHIITVGYCAFCGDTSLVSVTFPTSSEHNGGFIDRLAFGGCKNLTTVSIPFVSNIYLGAFEGCSKLNSIAIPETVTDIEVSAFKDCISLTNIKLPQFITDIDNSLFEGCINLNSLTIPTYVRSISAYGLMNCKNLKSIKVNSIEPFSVGKSAFDGINMDSCILYVPYGYKSAYKSAYQWSIFKNIVEVDFVSVLSKNIMARGYQKCSIPVGVFSNISWIATADSSWININHSSGTGNDTIDLDIKPNPYDYARTAIVTIKSLNNLDTLRFIVTQQAKPELSISTTDIRLSQNRTFSTVNFTSNAPCSAISNSPWLSAYIDDNSYYPHCSIIADSNQTGSTRVATVSIFTDGLDLQTITITQAAGQPILTVSSLFKAFDDTATSDTIVVTSNISWGAYTSDQWLSLNQVSGTGNDSIVITAEANPTVLPRTAYITLYASGTESQKITITQAAGLPALSITSTTLSPTNNGYADSIFVTSNAPWTISSDKSWLTFNVMSGTGNGNTVFFAEPNPTTSPRSAIVSVTVEGIDPQTITITQDAGQPVIHCVTSNVAFDEATTTDTISIISNTTWVASYDASWLSINQTSGTGNDSLVFTTEPNTTIYPRTVNVTISAAGAAPQTITITQAAGESVISAPETSFTLEESSSVDSIFLTSNTPWQASSDASWLTLSPASGQGNDTIIVTAGLNTGAQRTATITIVADSSGTQKAATFITITVTQQAATLTGLAYADDRAPRLYPNPASNRLNILLPAGFGDASVSVFSIQGTRACSATLVGNSVDVSSLPAGTYILQVTGKTTTISQKFTKR